MPYPAKLIAFAFVQKGISENYPITQMKVQKLVYFANGYHLAVYENQLIEEQIEAWDFGPVVPELYQLFKFYGTRPIDTTILMENGNLLKEVSKLNSNANDAIEYTWDALKYVDAIKLSNWTHKDDSPWQKTYHRGRSRPITNELIKPYFKQMLFKTDATTEPQTTTR